MKLMDVAHKLLEFSSSETAEQRGQVDSSKITLAAFFKQMNPSVEDKSVNIFLFTRAVL